MIQPSSAQRRSHHSCWELELFDMNKPLWWTDFWSVPGVMDGWGWGCQCSMSLHLFQNLYFFLSSFKPVFTVWENYTLISFFSTWSQDQTNQTSMIQPCFKEIFSPKGGEESTAQQDLLEASQLFHVPIWETLRCSQDGWVMDADKDVKMKAASHWMKSSLCCMQWQNIQV